MLHVLLSLFEHLFGLTLIFLNIPIFKIFNQQDMERVTTLEVSVNASPDIKDSSVSIHVLREPSDAVAWENVPVRMVANVTT